MNIEEAKTIVRDRLENITVLMLSNLVHHAHEKTGIVLENIQQQWISEDGKEG